MPSSAPDPGRTLPQGPLTGYRVLDLTGPLGVYCTKLLADLGADVVRVEPPTGDPMRRLPPFYRGAPEGEVSLYYLHMNTSKRAVTLDLRQPRGRGLLLRLVKGADVLVQSFPPGYLDALGLGYAVLKEHNPGLVLTAITPFGQTGPYRDYKASDLVGQAMGGLMSITGYAEGPPLRLAGDQGYHTVSVHACVGTLLALYHREETGQGQQVDASLQEAVALTVPPATQSWDLKREVMGQTNPRFGTTWPCKDGYVSVALGRLQALERVAEWLVEEGMGQGLGEARWEDPDWTARARQQVEQGLQQLLARYTKREVVEEAQRRRLWIAPVNAAADIHQDPQLQARGFFQQVAYPELGVTLTHPGAPFKMSGSPWQMSRRAPQPGEDNEAIYIQELGLSLEELAQLRRQGVI